MRFHRENLTIPPMPNINQTRAFLGRFHCFTPVLCGLLVYSTALSANAETLFVDAVVASVDGKPITLQDVTKKLGRNVGLRELGTDTEARATVDDLINERLINEEAESKHFQVTEDDVKHYIDEVSKKNSLSTAEFEQALAGQGKSLESYKNEIKLEILKSRIAQTYIRGSVGVSAEDIEKYLTNRSLPTSSNSSRVKLRQIVLLSEKHSAEDAKNIFGTVVERLNNGDSFEDLAKEISEAPDAADGGKVGTVAEKDLSPEIFDAIVTVEEEAISRVVKTEGSYRLFYVEKRLKPETEEAKPEFDQKEKDDARQVLEQERYEAKLNQFFTEDLYRLHAVDKKI